MPEKINDTRAIFDSGLLLHRDSVFSGALQRILLRWKLKSAAQGRIVRADRQRAAAHRLPSQAQHRTRTKEIGKWKPSRRSRIFKILSSTRHERNGTTSRSTW